jgi:hypothetical protein
VRKSDGIKKKIRRKNWVGMVEEGVMTGLLDKNKMFILQGIF